MQKVERSLSLIYCSYRGIRMICFVIFRLDGKWRRVVGGPCRLFPDKCIGVKKCPEIFGASMIVPSMRRPVIRDNSMEAD